MDCFRCKSLSNLNILPLIQNTGYLRSELLLKYPVSCTWNPVSFVRKNSDLSVMERSTYKSQAPGNIITGNIFNGDFYQVKKWSFDSTGDKRPAKGYNDCLCFVLIRSGHFHFDLGNKSHEMHSGTVVIDKPDYEYSLSPAQGQCSIFNFTDAFYDSIIDEYNLQDVSFFTNENILVQALSCTAAIDYLHHRVLQQMNKDDKLEMDTLVLELLRQVIEGISHKPLTTIPVTTTNKVHLSVIERAKEYMNTRFLEDISLLELARHCFVSPFYFSRLFKTLTGLPPYKYLQEIRLKHAEMLVKNSTLPITDICYAAGFKNTDYFSAAFTKKFKSPPTKYKMMPGCPASGTMKYIAGKAGDEKILIPVLRQSN